MGYHQCHKTDFGAILIPEIKAKNLYSYQKLLYSVEEEAEQEKTLARIVQVKLQGQWTKWSSFVRIDLSWKQILIMPTSLLSFRLGAIYESLPSPSTLHGWNITTKNPCKLWQKECTTMHVLGG